MTCTIFIIHELDSGMKLVLKQDDCIAILASRDNGSIVNDLLTENYVNLSPMLGEIPKEVLNAFDDNIEYLRTTDDTSNGIQLLISAMSIYPFNLCHFLH